MNGFRSEVAKAERARALFALRYPLAAATLEELARDPAVPPELFDRVCAAIFDVADRHVEHEPGPAWR